MCALTLAVLGMWSLIALVTGLSLGAMIGKADRKRKVEFLDDLFSSVATLQAYNQNSSRKVTLCCK